MGFNSGFKGLTCSAEDDDDSIHLATDCLVLFFHLCDLLFFSFLYLYCFGIRTGNRLGRRTTDIPHTLLSLLICVTFITELTVLPSGEHIKFCT